jgi:cell division septum initiation protein DivIVA
MTDPDERIINRAIVLVEDQDVREEARAALHRLFRDRRRLEAEVERLREERNRYFREAERLRLSRDGWKATAEIHAENQRDREQDIEKLLERLRVYEGPNAPVEWKEVPR